MVAQNIREPNRNSHEEYSTQKSKSVGAKRTETDHQCLTFKNRASYIQDGRTTTLQMLHFIFFFQQI
jgi:hypothetical protein